MAMEGSLAEMPLRSMLPALRRRSGTLDVWNVGHDRRRFRLLTDRGDILAILDTDHQLEPLPARRALQLIVADRAGNFRWRDGGVCTGIDSPLNWPLELAMVSGTEPLLSPASATKLELDTRYHIKDGHLEPWLDDELFAFWERASPLLRRGATPRELAKAAHVSDTEAFRQVARLRALGKVEPARAFRLLAADELHRGIATRLIGALRRGRT